VDLPLVVSADTTSVTRGAQDLDRFSASAVKAGASLDAAGKTSARGTAQLAAQTDRLTGSLRSTGPGATGLARALGEIGAEALSGTASMASLTQRIAGAALGFGTAGLAVAALLPVAVGLFQAVWDGEDAFEALEGRLKTLKDATGAATSALEKSRQSITELVEEFGSLTPEAREAYAILADARVAEAIAKINGEAEELGSTFGNLGVIFRSNGLSEAAIELEKTFGMTRAEALRVAEALRALKAAEGPEAIAKAAVALADALRDAYGPLEQMPPEIRATVIALSEAAIETGTLQGEIEDAKAEATRLWEKAVGISVALSAAAGVDLSAVFRTAFPNASALLGVVQTMSATLSESQKRMAAMAALDTMAYEFSPGGQAQIAYGSRTPGGNAAQNALASRNRPIEVPSFGGSGGGGGGAVRDAYSEQQVELAERLRDAERERAALLGGQDMERYAAIQQALNAATGEGATLTEEQTAAITRQAGALYDLEKQAESLKTAIDNITSAGEEFGTAMGKALGDAVFGFGNLRDAARAAFQDLVTSILQELGKLAASKMLQMILGGAGGGGFSLNLGSLGIPGLAAGGYVTRPTLAVVGEAGPEAVVPLSRGPEAMGAFGKPQMTVNVTNEMGGQAQVETRQSDPQTLEVIIRAAEDRVADGIQRGTGRVGRALEGTYGISRRGR
jgi:prefoldin subunit 5